MTRSSIPIETRSGGVEEAELLQLVEHLHRLLDAVAEIAEVDQASEPLLLEKPVDVGDLRRELIVEDNPADGGLDDLVRKLEDLGMDQILVVERGGEIDERTAVEEADGERLHRARLEREHHVLHRGERPALALRALLLLGHVVAAEHHILGGNGEGLPVGRRQDVPGREHEKRSLDLRLRR
jgi:hypothetical protein